MYRIYIDDFWLIGDIIILKTKKEIKMKRITKSLPFKLLLGVCIGIIVGLLAGEGLMNIIVTVKYILGQYINFCVPLIVIGFIAPSIPKLEMCIRDRYITLNFQRKPCTLTTLPLKYLR